MTPSRGGWDVIPSTDTLKGLLGSAQHKTQNTRVSTQHPLNVLTRMQNQSWHYSKQEHGTAPRQLVTVNKLKGDTGLCIWLINCLLELTHTMQPMGQMMTKACLIDAASICHLKVISRSCSSMPTTQCADTWVCAAEYTLA